MSSTTETSTEALVDRCFQVRNAVKELEKELLVLEEYVIARGPGKHSGTDPDRVITVVAESEPPVTYKLGEDDVARAREVADGAFAKLFEKKVTYSPCKSFADVVAKILPAAAARKVLAITECIGKPRRAYCLYK